MENYYHRNAMRFCWDILLDGINGLTAGNTYVIVYIDTKRCIKRCGLTASFFAFAEKCTNICICFTIKKKTAHGD